MLNTIKPGGSIVYIEVSPAIISKRIRVKTGNFGDRLFQTATLFVS